MPKLKYDSVNGVYVKTGGVHVFDKDTFDEVKDREVFLQWCRQEGLETKDKIQCFGFGYEVFKKLTYNHIEAIKERG